MNRSLRYLAPVVAVAMLAGCGLNGKSKDADAEVARFHAALNAGRWHAIWDGAGHSTLTVTTQTTFERGSGTEEFVFTKDADQPLKLVGYHINSAEMMLD